MHPTITHPRYRAGEILGRGAQGVVVRVVDREDPERALVAKVLGDSFDEQALVGEFALLSRLRIPGLVRAHDLGRDTATGARFLVEDYVGGVTAEAWIDKKTERLAHLLADVAGTLAQLHDAGFVHGDIKPAHVRHDGRAMLLDLGAAVHRAQRDAPLLHTPAFSAPEIRAGGRPTPASDLYALAATCWAACTGKPPAEPRQLRRAAPWVAPALAELLAALLAPHPRDRPGDARDVLGRLGLTGVLGGALPPAPIGRERELAELTRAGERVRYLVGPAGIGKSHLARELCVRLLMAGRAVRLLSLPDDAFTGRLIAYLRGNDAAWPFVETDTLVVLDDLERGPAELANALDAYRCSQRRAAEFLATVRRSPEGASAIELGAIAGGDFDELCRALGVHDAQRIHELARASQGSPGWLVAELGCVPLTPDTAIERARSLSQPARTLLATVALMGGRVREEAVHDAAAVGELLAAALITRRAGWYALASEALAADIARAVATEEDVERTTAALLADPQAPASALLALAGSERVDLLLRAAARARACGLWLEELDALRRLASAGHREPEHLRRLERLSRDTGETHPQVLGWLEEAARDEPSLVPLWLRRAAEQKARDGDADGARDLGERARSATRGEPVGEALALATQGLVALFRGDFAAAERILAEARTRVAALDVGDPEEVARLDHNLGVVAVHRGRLGEAIAAFERSLADKRRLGDRAGMRSCLLNLGIALSRSGRFDEAERALVEGAALARSLGQKAGLAWCLAARADLELRRGNAASASRWTDEAEAMREALPATVASHLALVRAGLALLDGDGQAALTALGEITAAARADDALLDARALCAEARARLARLPAEPRRAARLAVAAARRARAAALPEAETEALEVLGSARRRRKATVPSYASDVAADDSWRWLESLAQGIATDEAMLSLARLVAKKSGAERVLIARVQVDGGILDAWGVDLDGLPLSAARERVPGALVQAALARSGPVYVRETDTPGGSGSCLAVASGKAVVVVEHRFVPGRFDSVDAEEASRWATLAALVLRLTPPLVEAPFTDNAHTTVVPVGPRRSFPGIVGQSASLRRAVARLSAALESELPALIVGETGSGKELFARALHDHGPRSLRPFVAVNCAAIPEALFEAELFGHARGSFTGAERARPGLLAHAEGGTLFLDEIGELPLLRQAALLRALEARRYRPVGSDEERAFNVRVVAATNRDLERAVREGTFRQDLWYRLNAVEIRVPPLRERPEDIPLLVKGFLPEGASLTPEAMDALSAYEWPGNVRELEHHMVRLAGLGIERIELGHLPRALRKNPPRARASGVDQARAEILTALDHNRGNISHAARALGLTRQGLKKRMVRLGLRESAKKGQGS